MKATRLVLSLMFLLSLLLLSGCGPSQSYTFPDPIANTTVGPLMAPYQNFPNTLKFGETHECLMYNFTGDLPSLQVFQAYYQAEMEKQGWTGGPTEVTEMESKLIASWVDEDNEAGLIVVYSPELWTAIVCVGNP